MALQREAWQQAQNISVGIDLVPAARAHLAFLAEVNSKPWLFESRSIERAIRRYENCWLPLVAAAVESVHLVPPVDCALVWHCHRLNPVQYAEDCKRMFGRTISAICLGKASEKVTIDLWSSKFPKEPYDLGLDQRFPSEYDDAAKIITYDLFDAISRQRTFYYQVSEPHYLDERFLKTAAMRYKGFLYLMKGHKDVFFVPTYDIDLMWHTHQLHAEQYQADSLAILGKLLNHDDTDSNRNPGQKLDTGFTETSTLWEATYGRPYPKAGCMYRGEPPAPLPHEQSVATSELTEIPASGLEELWMAHSRATLKVHVAIRGAKGISSEDKVFVRLKALRKCRTFKLETPATSSLLKPDFSHSWSFDTEISSQGLILELRSPRLLGGSSKRHSLVVTWESTLEAETQSVAGKLSTALGSSRIEIPFFISITPPAAGPYLLRNIASRPTGPDRFTVANWSRTKEIWLTRTVLNHHKDEAYIIRSRYIPTPKLQKVDEEQQVINVHLGGWLYASEALDDGKVPQKIVASAQLVDSAPDTAKWKLALPRPLEVTIMKDSKDPKWNMRPQFRVDGCATCPVVLVAGRKLQYQVQYASEKEEAGFVTVVRYTKSAPQGRATALFNWKTGAMEISSDEDVFMALLLSSAVALSISDLLGKKIKYDARNHWRRKQRGIDDWGIISDTTAGGIMATWPWWMQLGHHQETSRVAGCGAGRCGAGSGGCGGGCGGGGANGGKCGGAGACGGGGGCGGGGCAGGCGSDSK